MDFNKMNSVAYLSPTGKTKVGDNVKKSELYAKEKDAVKHSFGDLGPAFSWSDSAVDNKLREFARLVIKTTNDMVAEAPDVISNILPVETIQPGDSFKLQELHGVSVYYGTYGASVRMSRPQFTTYTATTNLKEIGLKLDLTQVRTGKYSPSELATYVSGLVNAWRNHLLFTTTLAGMTAYSSGGAQYVSGAGLGFGTMTRAFASLTDEADAAYLVGRRQAIHALSNMSGWTDTGITEFQRTGSVGSYAGIPVLKVDAFTDPDYGTVYPMPATELWLFSSLPAGRMVVADRMRTAEEVVLRNETMNMYFRWDDGVGIFYTNRIARIAAIT